LHRKVSTENFVRKTIFVAIALMGFSAVASAQIPTGGNIFFGYSYGHERVFSPSANQGVAGNGWEGSLEGKFLPWIGIVADLDWHYGGARITNCIGTGCTGALVHVNASRHDILFGPRASVSVGKFTPFAELLIGVAHQTDSGGGVSNSDTAFATAVGGGLDYKLIKGVAWRLQIDSIYASLFGHGESNLRVSTGIVFRF
jgi:opacity protein-like surface antigen